MRDFKKQPSIFLGKGHQRIAYCTGAKALVLQPKGLNIDSDRYRGFIETLSKAGKSADPDQMFTRIHTMEDGKRVMKKILNLSCRKDRMQSLQEVMKWQPEW